MQDTPVRLDKWLWAARFYKTRSLATDAVIGGHVRVNGQRVKASRQVQIDDEIRITKSGEQITANVLGLSARRGSATQAQQLYQETEQSIEQRDLSRMQRKINAMANPRPRGKPDKRQRRQLKAWQEQWQNL